MIKRIENCGGSSTGNLIRGDEGVEYGEIVKDVADDLGIEIAMPKTEEEVRAAEEKIVLKEFEETLRGLNPEQRKQLEAAVREAAKELDFKGLPASGALAAIAAAQLSGFGIYMAASTTAAAAAGVLGITLPFAFYTGMTSVLAFLISGPVMVVVGGLAIWKLGSPNKKLLKCVVCLVASKRLELEFKLLGRSAM